MVYVKERGIIVYKFLVNCSIQHTFDDFMMYETEEKVQQRTGPKKGK